MKVEFKRPLGVFLQGGGALGAWQAAVLETFEAHGLRFDAVMGFSIGAVNGSALAFNRLPEALARWRALNGRALQPAPRLNPVSLCSIEPLLAFLVAAGDDEAAQAALGAEFTIISACPAEDAPINARYTPQGRDGWDGPLVEHVAASCAIPFVFPPVNLRYRGRSLRLIDGGVPMRAPLDFSPLVGCAEIIVVEMVRAEDIGRRWWTPWRSIDQRCRETARALVDEALQPLLRSSRPAHVHRLAPSQRLEPMMLDFRQAGLAKMLVQGTQDAQDFLSRVKLL